MYQSLARPSCRRAVSAMLLSATALAGLFGCNKQQRAAAVTPPKPKAPPTVSEIDLKSYKPNEAGAVMIVMYHRFEANEPSSNRKLNRNPDDFRKDLETLYKQNYRPVTLSEFVENRMDLPPGKTPIVLTFDDASPTQFRLITGSQGQATIDPKCAVGVMEVFNKEHPDWATKGTFFVLPEASKGGHMTPPPFGDAGSSSDKLDYLVSKGYEIQNHSSTHPDFGRLSAEKIQEEIGYAVSSIRKVQPKASMDILALPYGKLPRKKLRPLAISGSGAGATYENKAIVLAAWRPVASPVTRVGKKTAVYQIAPYDPYRLERVTPAPDMKGQQTFEYWLQWFQENPTQRYVSDGNPEVVAVPQSLASLVDEAAVKSHGQTLQLYKLGGGVGGGGLSVEGAGAASSGSSGSLSVEPSSVGARR